MDDGGWRVLGGEAPLKEGMGLEIESLISDLQSPMVKSPKVLWGIEMQYPELHSLADVSTYQQSGKSPKALRGIETWGSTPSSL